MNCKDCTWWKLVSNVVSITGKVKSHWAKGRCFRYPQTVEKRGNEMCGEFQPQENK